MKKRVLSVLLSACMLFGGCAKAEQEKINYPQEIQNFEKLCKVWGYTKYTHPAFLSGEKDWDAELFALIPQIQQANESEEVNEILNEWLLSLGEIKYETDKPVQEWENAEKEDIVVIAETDWIFDEKYLGKELSENMLPLTEPIPDVKRYYAPINFDKGWYAAVIQPYTMFTQEKFYDNMDYSDVKYRLLGLFRLWNVMEYYNPNIDVIDNDWEDLLPVFIEKMLSNSDEQSYHLTIAELSSNLQDAHVGFGVKDFLKNEFGKYWLSNVEFTYAEGEVVVVQTLDGDDTLQSGDIIRKLDGIDIKERIEMGKKYCSVPADDKIVNALELYLLRTHSETPEITIIRDGQEMTLTVKADESVPLETGSTYGVKHHNGTPSPYEIIEGNIGVINPGFMNYKTGVNNANDIHYILAMEALKDTDGLIIDLRQYPGNSWTCLTPYVFDEPEVGQIIASFSKAVPGSYIKESVDVNISKFRSSYYYDKEIVILIDEHSQSAPEYSALFLSGAENVTLIGSNTAGATGYCLILPLPCGHGVMYTVQKSYTPGGEQLNRVGITPDIEVKPTIQGIKEGRDELKEAAVEFLKSKK